METQKIANLLGDADNESSKFATKKWYVINDQNNADYGEGNEDSITVKFENKVIKSNLCDFSDAYILLTGNITAAGGDTNTRVAFKNCVPFTKCITHINDEHVDNADSLDIIMSMYNLIEYSDNYSDSSGNLWQFKRKQTKYGQWTHPAIKRRGDVVTASVCTSQPRYRYVPNETTNDIFLERRQDVSVVCLHNVLLERCDDVLTERNNDVPSVCLRDVSKKSQMKHPTTSQ